MPADAGRRTCHAAAVAAAAWLALAAPALHAQAPAKPLPEMIAACTACHGTDGNAPNPQWPSIAGQPRLFI